MASGLLASRRDLWVHYLCSGLETVLLSLLALYDRYLNGGIIVETSLTFPKAFLISVIAVILQKMNVIQYYECYPGSYPSYINPQQVEC